MMMADEWWTAVGFHDGPSTWVAAVFRGRVLDARLGPADDAGGWKPWKALIKARDADAAMDAAIALDLTDPAFTACCPDSEAAALCCTGCGSPVGILTIVSPHGGRYCSGACETEAEDKRKKQARKKP